MYIYIYACLFVLCFAVWLWLGCLHSLTGTLTNDTTLTNTTIKLIKAYTNQELLPHTDCTYYRDPPALQVYNKREG